MRTHHRGLTIVELLVSIAILILLVGLLLPAVLKARESARSTQCKNNLHQLALGFRLYADANNDRLPDTTDVTWAVQIAPFLELQEDTFRCPSDPGGAEMGYYWRDDAIILKSSALSGKKIDLVAKAELALVFDQIVGRHGKDTFNVGFLNGEVMTLSQIELEKNLLLAVDSGGMPSITPENMEKLLP